MEPLPVGYHSWHEEFLGYMQGQNNSPWFLSSLDFKINTNTLVKKCLFFFMIYVNKFNNLTNSCQWPTLCRNTRLPSRTVTLLIRIQTLVYSDGYNFKRIEIFFLIKWHSSGHSKYHFDKLPNVQKHHKVHTLKGIRWQFGIFLSRAVLLAYLKLSFMSCRCVGKEELTKAERICAGAKSVVEIRFVLLTKWDA